ncbi:MAG: selB [Deltaproteobacteria bacterium]|nr:selB [Deltaproteobacteria bacterium]
MGTAGHVDHGKTALIKALTQIDCDTHEEEKRRGITIHLGFAHMNLKNGESLGIVDVPGHKDFIHTMVGGASGIDFVLMVIAADSGIMPQTREHLNIMKILGIKHGLIALTKVDLVDEEILELATDDIKEFVKGTFLENAPVVPVSAKTGSGIDQLQDAIEELTRKVESKPSDGVFRMFIDRIFSVSGFGTVVTGSVMSGKAKNGDTLYLRPGKEQGYRVRRLEKHGVEIGEVVAGDRASINVVGLEKSDFRRGMLLSDKLLRETRMFDAKLEIFEPGVTLGMWSQVIFHVGTYEQQARVHLLDKTGVKTGEAALVQIHLHEPCILQLGDRFVIRSSSDEWTLGGGKIIDVSPLHHRRRKENIIKDIEKLAAGELSEIIAQVVHKLHRVTTTEEIAFSLNLAVSQINERVAKRLPDEIAKLETKDDILLFTRQQLDELHQGIKRAIQEFMKENQLAGRGVNFDEIQGSLKIEKNSPGEKLLRWMLQQQTEKGMLKEKDKTWQFADASGDVDQKLRSLIKVIENYIKSCGMQVPLMSVMKEITQKHRMNDKDLKQVLHHLTLTGLVYRVGEEIIDKTVVDSCRKKLIDHLLKENKGITVAGFRDLVGGNRKSSLLMLLIFDNEKLLRREGDLRFLWKAK